MNYLDKRFSVTKTLPTCDSAGKFTDSTAVELLRLSFYRLLLLICK